jgi:hypothetical protein
VAVDESREHDVAVSTLKAIRDARVLGAGLGRGQNVHDLVPLQNNAVVLVNSMVGLHTHDPLCENQLHRHPCVILAGLLGLIGSASAGLIDREGGERERTIHHIPPD